MQLGVIAARYAYPPWIYAADIAVAIAGVYPSIDGRGKTTFDSWLRSMNRFTANFHVAKLQECGWMRLDAAACLRRRSFRFDLLPPRVAIIIATTSIYITRQTQIYVRARDVNSWMTRERESEREEIYRCRANWQWITLFNKIGTSRSRIELTDNISHISVWIMLSRSEHDTHRY